jgi:hypothetical protein
MGSAVREYGLTLTTGNPAKNKVLLNLHVLNNRHEYGKAEQTTELLTPCDKGMKMNCWESFFIHILQNQNVLFNEQGVNDLNPLYQLARDITLHN